MLYCTDFSGLLVLAIGCNIVYIVKGDGTNFFLFLDKIDSIKEVFIKKIDDDSHKIPRIIVSIKPLLEMPLGELKKKFGRNAKKIVKKFLKLDLSSISKDSIDKKNDHSKKYFESLSKYKSARNLRGVAFVTFLYGFYISIFAPYFASDESGVFNKSLLPMNLYIFVISFICLLCDIRGKKIFKRHIFFLILPLVIYAMLFGIFDRSITDWLFPEADLKHYMFHFIEIGPDRFNSIFDYNYIFTVLMCFAGFLWYIASVVFGSMLAMKYKFFMKDYKDIIDFEKYKSQLDEFAASNIENISLDLKELSLPPLSEP